MFSQNPHDLGTGMRTVSSSAASWISPEQYLEAERRAETKSEYFARQVFPMPGSSLRHNRIVRNLVVALHAQLRRSRCEVLPSDMRVKVLATGLYAYPDVTVVCGEPQLEDAHLDTLLNPILLVDVLSESTERYDRGRKAEHYRSVPSLEEYLFVSQQEPRIERYRRHGEREWVLNEAIGLHDAVELPSIGTVLRLHDVYDQVF
jgi:Uma2 family endonuclease